MILSSVRIGSRLVLASMAVGFMSGPNLCVVYAREVGLASVTPPLVQPDFHFSDRARDARYLQLQGDVERTLATFRQAVSAASEAVAVPGPRPGSPAWFAARTLVERALLARRPVGDALHALTWFLRHERPQLTAEEAVAADAIIESHEGTLLATSDHLVDLFARLAGVRVGQWPP